MAAEQELGNTLTPLLLRPQGLMFLLFQMMSLGHSNSFLQQHPQRCRLHKLQVSIALPVALPFSTVKQLLPMAL